MSPAAGQAASLDPDALAHLEEQRAFLLRSLADLEREHDAGDLDDVDYAELRDDYTARAAETLRAIDQQRAAFGQARPVRSRGRVLAVFGSVALLAVIAGVMVATSLGARKAGETSSGGIDVAETPSQRANACIAKIDQSGRNPGPAITCFQGVLDDDPESVVALTWLGWQLSLSAPNFDGDQRAQLADSATRLLGRAVEANPDYSYARALRAVVAYRNGDAKSAKTYLADFRSHDPSPDAEAIIAQQDLDANIAALEAANPPGTGSTPPSTTATTTPPG